MDLPVQSLSIRKEKTRKINISDVEKTAKMMKKRSIFVLG